MSRIVESELGCTFALSWYTEEDKEALRLNPLWLVLVPATAGKEIVI